MGEETVSIKRGNHVEVEILLLLSGLGKWVFWTFSVILQHKGEGGKGKRGFILSEAFVAKKFSAARSYLAK